MLTTLQTGVYSGRVETFSAPERPSVPASGEEKPQLDAWLDFLRATLLHKCDGLSAAQLKERPVASSRLSLLGIVRHMTFVEQAWFDTTFAGHDPVEHYKSEGDRDADFNDLDSHALEEVMDFYLHELKVSREVSAGHDLSEVGKLPRRGRAVDLRWIYVHMIEEYARHCGHADLLREMIDGTTGY
ncbi:MAG TPA: DinB family protein [Acidimicrobiales bacterium]|nr:DinB family protein [Acidimicrobiales bacterium]